MRDHWIKAGILIFSFFLITGCAVNGMSNSGNLETYLTPTQEADWIRNGEPIEYDGKLWSPQDGTENVLDSEVYLMGEYRGVQFFIEKIDVKPYNRLYTKFGRNRFRYFELKKDE